MSYRYPVTTQFIIDYFASLYDMLYETVAVVDGFSLYFASFRLEGMNYGEMTFDLLSDSRWEGKIAIVCCLAIKLNCEA
jgi:hypothetical protein